MDIVNLLPLVYEKFIVFILVFTRISALFSTFILFRREMVNARVVISLTTILSIYVILLYQPQQINYDVYSLPMLMQMFMQFLVGFIAGLILNIVFEIFVGLGQIVSTQVGLSMASLIDPKFGTITSLTQFYSLMTIVIFLLLNGHLFVVKTIIDSFTTFPLYQNFLPPNLLSAVFDYSAVIFSGAIMLSITILITILLANIALAVMTKFAPQINVFSIGINMTLIFGLICVYLTFDVIVNNSSSYIRAGLDFLHQTVAGMGTVNG